MALITVTIADYGLGNLFSITRALRHLGAEVVITDNAEFIARSTHFILPGVGAFGEGMDNLKAKGMVEPIMELQRLGRPVLGICLGMQLLMTEGEEMGHNMGLNLINGRVIRFPNPPAEGPLYKIPHVGWNELHRPAHIPTWQGSLLDGLNEGDAVYFVHSYYVEPQNPSHTLAETEYGQTTYCSVIRQESVMGCQFHPEKSSDAGLRILQNFIKM